jgi:hypothetical protein
MSKNTNLSFLTDYITADITNGRIGINNASPTVAFDVSGITKFSSAVTVNGGLIAGAVNGNIRIKGSTDGFLGAGESDNKLYLTDWTTAAKGLTILLTTGAATFSSNVTIGSTLSNSLSVGLTQPTTDTLNQIFAGQGAFGAQAAGGETDIGNNWYYYSGFKYRITAPSSNIKLNGDVISFERAVSGSANAAISFAESMRITSAGKVGIGFTAPGGKLDVQDTGTTAPANGQPGTGFNVKRSDGVLGVAIGYNDEPATFYIQSNRMDGGTGIAYNLALSPVRGNVLIATYTDNGYKLYVNGNAAGPSGFANVSDRRLKKDITPIENGLDKIKQLNGVSFNWDKTIRPDLVLDDKNHLGLIAQDVEEILPQVVQQDTEGNYSVAYGNIVGVLIEAIKELNAKIDRLENK